MFITVSGRLAGVSRVLLACLIAALGLNASSVFRAHKNDLFRPAWEVLRPQDRTLVEMGRAYVRHGDGYVPWPAHDAAYAEFPVKVDQEQLPHTMKL